MAASRTIKAGEVRRAKIILRLAAGHPYRAIMKQEGCSQDFIARWKERFVKERLAGLHARHRGKIVSEEIIGLEARILKEKMLPTALTPLLNQVIHCTRTRVFRK
jgi:transposase